MRITFRFLLPSSLSLQSSTSLLLPHIVYFNQMHVINEKKRAKQKEKKECIFVLFCLCFHQHYEFPLKLKCERNAFQHCDWVHRYIANVFTKNHYNWIYLLSRENMQCHLCTFMHFTQLNFVQLRMHACAQTANAWFHLHSSTINLSYCEKCLHILANEQIHTHTHTSMSRHQYKMISS